MPDAPAWNKLTHAWLRNCSFTGTIPAVWSTYDQMLNIDLSQNNITGSLPAHFSTMPRLNAVFLNNNSLTGEMVREQRGTVWLWTSAAASALQDVPQPCAGGHQPCAGSHQRARCLTPAGMHRFLLDACFVRSLLTTQCASTPHVLQQQHPLLQLVIACTQPRPVTRAAAMLPTLNLARPCVVMCWWCAAMCGHVRPCAAMCCYVLLCVAMCGHVRPCGSPARSHH